MTAKNVKTLQPNDDNADDSMQLFAKMHLKKIRKIFAGNSS